MRGFIHQSCLEAALNSSSDHSPETWWNYVSAGETTERPQLSPAAWYLHSRMLLQAQDGQLSVDLTRPWLVTPLSPCLLGGFLLILANSVQVVSLQGLAARAVSWRTRLAPPCCSPAGTAALPLSRARVQKPRDTPHAGAYISLGVTFCLISAST